jgi:hypothetical protein
MREVRRIDAERYVDDVVSVHDVSSRNDATGGLRSFIRLCAGSQVPLPADTMRHKDERRPVPSFPKLS